MQWEGGEDQSRRRTRNIEMTDAELMRRVAAGERQSTIAQELGVSRAAVGRRLKEARERLPLSHRAEEVLMQFQELAGNYHVLQEVRDECLRRLRNSEGRIDLVLAGLWSSETEEGGDAGGHGDAEITHASRGYPGRGNGSTARRSAGSGKKTEHPVTLLLQTLEAMRHHLAMVAQMTDRLYEVQEVERFQNEVLAAVEEADSAIADRIRINIHQRRADGRTGEADWPAEKQ
jgi:predicted transcriptional regulator